MRCLLSAVQDIRIHPPMVANYVSPKTYAYILFKSRINKGLSLDLLLFYKNIKRMKL